MQSHSAVVVIIFLISVRGISPNCVNIDGKHYLVSIKLASDAISVLSDEDNNLFFVKAGKIWKLKNNTFTPELLEGAPHGISVEDIIFDDEGNIIIGTIFKGIHRYNLTTRSSHLYRNSEDLFVMHMAKSKNGKIFIENMIDGFLYSIDEEIVNKVPDITGVGPFTFSNNNDLYYYDIYTTNYTLKRAEQMSLSIPLTGIAAGLLPTKITYDFKTNKVYAGTSDGLYYLSPPSTAFTKVEGFDNLTAIGFDADDNIYLGMDRYLFKLEPVSQTECGFEGCVTDSGSQKVELSFQIIITQIFITVSILINKLL